MTTPIPDDTGGPPKPAKAGSANPDNGGVTSASASANGEPIALSQGDYAPLFTGPHGEDREAFKADTITFDFDSATIKASEEPKLQDLANHFKDNKKFEGLIIEGNADVRGTEKYNLSLGERRALAAREYLANLGVDPHRLKTVTYGASHPVEQGHDESVFKKNRRDDFVLVTPK
jgi:outer membrane protein OmpA-like peptidoglycan-associated protein